MKRDRWNERYAERELVWGGAPNRLFVAEVDALPPGRALDLACGQGRHALWLAERGWRVTAVDFSDVAVGQAREAAAERGLDVDVVHGDLLSWVPERTTYDLVFVLYLQLRREELRAVLAHAAAAVAPGGTFLLIAHDVLNLTEGHGGPQDVAVLTTPEAVAAALGGLEVERAERVLRDVEGAERPAVDTLVRARRR